MNSYLNTTLLLTDNNRIEIIIPDVNINDWQDLLDFLRSSDSSLEYFVNERPSVLPDWVHDVFISKEPYRRLMVELHGITAVCHFSSVRTIQLYVDINEFNIDRNVQTLFRLMSTIGIALNKRVIMKIKNITDAGYFRYEPGEGMQYLAEGL